MFIYANRRILIDEDLRAEKTYSTKVFNFARILRPRALTARLGFPLRLMPLSGPVQRH